MKFSIQGHNKIEGLTDTGKPCFGSNLEVDSDKLVIQSAPGRYSLGKCPYCDEKNLTLTLVLKTQKPVLVI